MGGGLSAPSYQLSAVGSFCSRRLAVLPSPTRIDTPTRPIYTAAKTPNGRSRWAVLPVRDDSEHLLTRQDREQRGNLPLASPGVGHWTIWRLPCGIPGIPSSRCRPRVGRGGARCCVTSS